MSIKLIKCIVAILLLNVQCNGIFYWLAPLVGALLLLEIKEIKNSNRIIEKYYLIWILLLIIVLFLQISIKQVELYWPIHTLAEIILRFIIAYSIVTYLINKKNINTFINANFIFIVFLVYVWILSNDNFYLDLTTDNSIFSKNSLATYLYLLIILISYRILSGLQNFKELSIYIISNILILSIGSSKIFLFSTFIQVIVIIFYIKKKFYPLLIGILMGVGIYIYNLDELSNLWLIIFQKYFSFVPINAIRNNFDLSIGDHHILERQELVQIGYHSFLDSPILGIGLENTRLISDTYTHNNFIELLSGTGLICAISFYIPLLFQCALITKINNIKLVIFALYSFLSLIIIGMYTNIYRDQFLLSIMFIQIYFVKEYSYKRYEI